MRLFIVLASALFIVSCSTTPKDEGPHTDVGVWQGKVLIVNTTTNNKKWASVVWISDSENDRMRVNVTAVMDYPVATYMQTADRNQLWHFADRTHFSSSNSKKLFKHLTKLSVDPKIFYSLLGEPKTPEGDWRCSDQAAKFRCVSKQYSTSFEVDHERKDKRIIRIKNGSKALQIRLSRAKVQVTEQHFREPTPSQFKTIEI